MNSKNNVRVNPLSNEEAWTLFMEELGNDKSLSPQVEQVARDITRECAGLPLGIKMIAGTMKEVDDMQEWSDALEDLKQSKVPQDKVEEEVFQLLRFSYNHLSDEALQQCFLYCGLFPKDFLISGENLIDYLIDEGVENGRRVGRQKLTKATQCLTNLKEPAYWKEWVVVIMSRCVKDHVMAAHIQDTGDDLQDEDQDIDQAATVTKPMITAATINPP